MAQVVEVGTWLSHSSCPTPAKVSCLSNTVKGLCSSPACRGQEVEPNLTRSREVVVTSCNPFTGQHLHGAAQHRPQEEAAVGKAAASQTRRLLASLLLPPAPGTAGRTPFSGLREPGMGFSIAEPSPRGLSQSIPNTNKQSSRLWGEVFRDRGLGRNR